MLGLAANTSFGGLPVLMSLLAQATTACRTSSTCAAERPVYRYGIVALAILAGALLVAVRAETFRLIPLFTIGVFVGFTISQTGARRALAQHQAAPLAGARGAERHRRGHDRDRRRRVPDSKFLQGAWVVVLTIPLLMVLFSRIEGYYAEVARELKFGKTPPPPHSARAS